MNLCKNGGFCGPSPSGTQCFCEPCWTGSTCEEPLLGCQYPCENGATYSGGVCHCAAGFTGPTCSNSLIFFFFLNKQTRTYLFK